MFSARRRRENFQKRNVLKCFPFRNRVSVPKIFACGGPIWFPVSQDLLKINNYYDSVSFTSWTQLATQITNRDPRQSCFCVPVHSVEHFLLVFCFFLSRSIVCSFIWSFTKPRGRRNPAKKVRLTSPEWVIIHVSWKCFSIFRHVFAVQSLSEVGLLKLMQNRFQTFNSEFK